MSDIVKANDNVETDGNDYVFGLDIGTRNVVGVVGYPTDNGFYVEAEYMTEHDTRAMLDGQIHDIGKVAGVVSKVKKELEEQISFPLTDVCIAAAGRVLRTVTTRVEMNFDEEKVITGEDINTLELIGVDQAHQDLLMEKGPYKFYCVGYTVMKYYLNGELFSNLEGHKATRIEAVIIATFLPEDVVDGLYSACERAKLSVANMTLEPIAAINVAIPQNFRMLNIALVDVGAGTSDICITRDGSIIAYGMIPYAGDELTEVLVQALLIDFATAENVKKLAVDNKEIKYKDIMGIEHTITSKEVDKITNPVMEKITKAVADKIKDLNGGKTVAACFVVGGGGKVNGFCKNLSKELEIIEERVALRGEEVMGNVSFRQTEVKKDPLLVTPIGICLSYYEQKNNFIMIRFNGQRMKLYDNGHLRIVDAAMQAGMDTDELFPQRGKELHYTVNGKQKILGGTKGEAAKITMNDVEAGLNTPLVPNAMITIINSTAGDGNKIKISQLDEFTGQYITFVVNGQRVTCPKYVEVNGKLEPGDYEIKDQDVIETRAYYTVGQLSAFMDVEIDPNYSILVNNKEASLDTLIYENFAIEWVTTGFGLNDGNYVPEGISGVSEDDLNPQLDYSPKDYNEDLIPKHDDSNPFAISEEEYQRRLKEKQDTDNEAETDNKNLTIHIKANGQDVTMSDKTEYIFVDIFNFIDFDTNEANGRTAYSMINGVECGYADPIHDGDEVTIEWRES
ncbi:MAG: rod shape-determining protein [Lachnospiraceae bacterium]|nr:rod shape-determining protein [Lachnospiraceae bacterium]